MDTEPALLPSEETDPTPLPPSAEEPAAVPQTGTGSSSVSVGDGYVVFADLPLPEFDTPGARAFAAEDRQESDAAIYALVGSEHYPPRGNLLNYLVGNEISGLVTLIDYEVAYWPPASRHVIIYFLLRPGPRLFHKDIRHPPVGEHDMAEMVVGPLVSAISNIADRSFTHRGVTADNVYWADANKRHAVLGEGFTTPPGLRHSALYETLTRCMAHPAGRGDGEIADDLYALGVTIALLGLGKNPLAHLDERSIIDLKLTKGSFQSIVGAERIPLTLLTPVRGLLVDDPLDRWGLTEIRGWVDGRRGGPLQTRQERKAARAQSFAGGDYYTRRSLADAMSRNWVQALAPIREGHVDIWLRRGLSDNDRAKKLGDAARSASYSSMDKRAGEDIMIARSLMVLDPEGPVRYKDFSCMIDGFGGMLAHEMTLGDGPRSWAETITRDVSRGWFEYQENFNQVFASLPEVHKTMKYYLSQDGPGYGVERCLYTLNPMMHCLSPLVEKECVISLSRLLPALDRAAQRIDQKKWPMDRHIAAFIAARASDDVEAQLAALEDTDDAVEHSRAIISLLAVVQWNEGPEMVNDLCAWVGEKMGPTVRVFHSTERRERVEREIPRLKKKGSLIDLYNLISDEDERRLDQQEFDQAIDEYSSAESEIFDLDSSTASRMELAEFLGHQVAAVACNMIAVITVASLLMIHMW